MQHTVSAPHAGTVTEIDVEPGAQVAAGEVLAVVRRSHRRRRGAGMTEQMAVQRVRGAPGAARAGGQAGRQVRPRVVHREGARRREDHRAVAGDRQERLPRHQHPRGVRRRWRRHRRHRGGLRGARRAGLPAAADGRQPGDLRHRHHPLRHRGAEAALAARHLRRHRHDGVRDHRARRRHQHPQHHHDRAPRRRRLGAQRAARSTSPASTRPTTCWSSPATEDARTGKLKPVPVRGADGRRGLRVHRDPDGDRQPGEPVPGVHRRRPAARRRAGRRRERRAWCSCSPGSTRSGSWRRRSRSGWPATRCARRRRTPRSARSSRPRSARTRRSRTRWRRATSRSRWPG